MPKQTITVPDIGGSENVDVIEVMVSKGDIIAAEDSMMVLESDKASMEIPCPVAGKVLSVSVKDGDKVSEGDVVLEIEVEGDAGGDEQSSPAQPDAPAKQESPAAPTASPKASELPVSVPDIGGSEGVDIIEVCVAIGDDVEEGDSLIVLESDKASMEIPSPASGKVLSIGVKEGGKVSEGDAILVLSSSAGAPVSSERQQDAPAQTAAAPKAAAPVASGSLDVAVPDIGGATGVDVIEVSVGVGDDISEGDSLIVLESDKASMEIPSPASGKVTSVVIKEGDKASEGSAILTLEVAGSVSAPIDVPHEAPAVKKTSHKPQRTNELLQQDIASSGSAVYAGPASRKLAREMGVALDKVKGSGPKSRISKDDIKAFVKRALASGGSSSSTVTDGSGIPAIPAVDFSKFGEIEMVKMSKIKKLTAANMSRNWLNVPHVTQFDDADITDLEEFRKGMKAEAEKSGVKLTPLPFLIKACAAALKAEPTFNVSLHSDGEHLVQKKYINIGIAVDTPKGLMVPVIRDADKKGLYEIAKETIVLAGKARDGKLTAKDMQGGCFTISSLGPIGGTGFTPIVNAPEVAILGVSKAAIKPVWNGSEFIPRQMLPLCLSYDHRAINGGDAGRFFTYLTSILGELRRFLL